MEKESLKKFCKIVHKTDNVVTRFELKIAGIIHWFICISNKLLNLVIKLLSIFKIDWLFKKLIDSIEEYDILYKILSFFEIIFSAIFIMCGFILLNFMLPFIVYISWNDGVPLLLNLIAIIVQLCAYYGEFRILIVCLKDYCEEKFK